MKVEVSDCVLEGSDVGIYHNGSNSGLKLNVTRTTINSGNDGTDTTGVYISWFYCNKGEGGVPAGDPYRLHGQGQGCGGGKVHRPYDEQTAPP